MMYRVKINGHGHAEGERWFARQVEGQYGDFAREPVPAELRRLLDLLSGASERPLS
jgi:hypothetical protein